MNRNDTTREKLAAMFDHTFLQPYADSQDLEKLCREAEEIQAAMVAINTEWTKFCKDRLKNTDVHVGAAVSFPLGQSGLETKKFETQYAIDQGADEIDYVIHIGKAREHDWDYLRKEMKEITAICRNNGVICKVIFENCYLTQEEIEQLARIAKEVKPDFIKTSTGFGPSGAKVEDIQLMKKTVGDEVQVKAAGGIRDLETALQMIDAGASRLGTSSALQILAEWDLRHPAQADGPVSRSV